MSIYSKPVAQIATDDLANILVDEPVENVRLEFKSELPDKIELIKKLSSFGNTYGGLVVIGAAAGSADGRLIGFPGIEHSPGLKQRVVQWCFDAISPPLEIEVSNSIPCPEDSSRACYVIKVTESELAPHFLNGRRGVYIRTDEYSQLFEPRLATLDEILRLVDRRRPIVERRLRLRDRARKRFLSFSNSSYGEFGRGTELGAHFLLYISPYYPAEALFQPHELLERLRSLNVPWRGIGFPRLIKGALPGFGWVSVGA